MPRKGDEASIWTKQEAKMLDRPIRDLLHDRNDLTDAYNFKATTRHISR